MTEKERQTVERQRNSSDYIKAAESFARYAHQEWIQDCIDSRALLICCVDRTIPDGVGSITLATGDGDLLAASLMQMQNDEHLGHIFRKARMINDTIGDLNESIRNLRSRLRMDYYMAALVVFWMLCVICFQIWGVANWITTVSNLLWIVFLGHMIGRDILERRKMLKRLTNAMQRDRIEMIEQRLRALYDSLMSRLRHDDSDDDDE